MIMDAEVNTALEFVIPFPPVIHSNTGKNLKIGSVEPWVRF